MSKPELTMAVLNWGRPTGTLNIINALKAQTRPPVVFVWNNGYHMEFPKADWVVNSSRNIACVAGWMMLTRAETKYIGTIGDDIRITDPYVMETCIDYLEEQSDVNMIIGAAGVSLIGDKNYADSEHITATYLGPDALEGTPVDIVKGWFMLMRREALGKVPRMMDRGFVEDDIFVSGHLGEGIPGRHRVLKRLSRRCCDCVDTKGIALSSRSDHQARRETARRKYCFGL